MTKSIKQRLSPLDKRDFMFTVEHMTEVLSVHMKPMPQGDVEDLVITTLVDDGTENTARIRITCVSVDEALPHDISFPTYIGNVYSARYRRRLHIFASVVHSI